MTHGTEMALVYMVTQKGGWAGNLFVLSTEDAKKLCSDDCSKGPSWMMMWTSLSTFKRHAASDKQPAPVVFLRDTGKQDADFQRLGIRKPKMTDMAIQLRQFGYELKVK